jgi:hypothetical protein
MWNTFGRPLALSAVAGTLISSGFGQQTQGATATPLAPRSRVTCEDTSPEARYDSFFRVLIGWDEAAKTSLSAGGDAEMAEAWRTRLQKYSGLTAEESEQVKQVARKYLADRQSFDDKAAAMGSAYRAAHPHEIPNINAIPPELDALRQERLDVVRRAEAELLTALGSRSFSRLDLYTIHMDDWSKNNNKAPKHNIPPCGGPQ